MTAFEKKTIAFIAVVMLVGAAVKMMRDGRRADEGEASSGPIPLQLEQPGRE